MAKNLENIIGQLHTPVEEAYKVLRTNVQFCGIDKKIKVISVTSCNPGEGKTTTAANLAISIARSGIKTLLIDGDLRKPSLAKLLKVNTLTGLTNIISGSMTLEKAVRDTNVENLQLLACGPKPPNAADLVSSARFTELLENIRELYDQIIIDSPPLGSVIDGAVIASQADGTILVVESKKVDYRSAQRVKEQLGLVNANILGVVLNRVPKADFKSYYNYNYEDYGKSKRGLSGWFNKRQNYEEVEDNFIKNNAILKERLNRTS